MNNENKYCILRLLPTVFHVAGYFAGGSREGLERARQTQCCSRITHLKKIILAGCHYHIP